METTNPRTEYLNGEMINISMTAAEAKFVLTSIAMLRTVEEQVGSTKFY